jgi:hypothetical protein
VIARLAGFFAFFGALATVHTWPMASDPAHLTRLDNDDTAFNTWVIAWVAHQAVADPLRLFEAPIFYPARHALAFSEHMLVQSLMGGPLLWSGASPVLVYNVLVWAGFTLSGLAMALLMRTWTGSTMAALASGCLYAFNAHLLTRYSHLQALHLEFFPLALYAFDRALRGSTRAGPLLVAGFVLQALCSNYVMVMMTMALAVALVVRAEPWRFERHVWVILVAAGVTAAAVLAPFLWPYYLARQEHGLVRTMDDVRLYSAGVLDYFVTAGRLHFTWWSHRVFDGRTALFPGVAGFALALTAVVLGTAWRDPRARIALAFGVLGLALSFGDALPGYEWLQRVVPLMQGIRAAARWGLLFLIAVAILAGFALAELERRWSSRRWWAAAAGVVLAMLTVEALRAPLALVRFNGIPSVHRRLNTDDVRAIVVYPLYAGERFHENAEYMLHQTRHWKPMLNAYSSFAPPIFDELAPRLQAFPEPGAIALLRAHGFSHVVIHRAAMEYDLGKAGVDGLRQHPDLEFVLEQEGVIVYRVKQVGS